MEKIVKVSRTFWQFPGQVYYQHLVLLPYLARYIVVKFQDFPGHSSITGRIRNRGGQIYPRAIIYSFAQEIGLSYENRFDIDLLTKR